MCKLYIVMSYSFFNPYLLCFRYVFTLSSPCLHSCLHPLFTLSSSTLSSPPPYRSSSFGTFLYFSKLPVMMLTDFVRNQPNGLYGLRRTFYPPYLF